MLRRLPAPEVARRTKRPIRGVYKRRWVLGIPDGAGGTERQGGTLAELS